MLLAGSAIEPIYGQQYNWVTLAGNIGGPGTNDGGPVPARFYFPSGVATDTNGNVFVADSLNRTIRKITPGGAVSTIAGTPGIQGNADGTGLAARFVYPHGPAADRNGTIYVADPNDATIRKITPAGVVTTFAGNGEIHGDFQHGGRNWSFRRCERSSRQTIL
jgi:hypothetical protein